MKILEYRNGVEHHDDLINEEIDGMLGMHNDDVLLSQSKVSILVREDFMLNKASCFAEICHDTRDFVKNDDLGIIYFEDCVVSLEEVSRHHFF